MAENASHIMLAERNQNAELRVQYGYNCVWLMGVRTRRGCGHMTIAWFVGEMRSETSFPSFFSIVLMFLLSCKIKMSNNDDNSCHLWYYINNIIIRACSVWATELSMISFHSPSMSVRWRSVISGVWVKGYRGLPTVVPLTLNLFSQALLLIKMKPNDFSWVNNTSREYWKGKNKQTHKPSK